MITAEDYCLRRSWRLRWLSADSRWLVRLAAGQLPAEPPSDFREHEREWRVRLGSSLREAVCKRYGNPVIIWILLNVVIPIVVRLVIEWWFKRRKAPDG